MTRQFKVEGSRLMRESVVWYVEADSFDEARDKAYDGYYDDFEVWDSDVDSEDVDDVYCRECGDNDEESCECGKTAPEDINASYGSGSSIDRWSGDEGMWIAPTDEYSEQFFGDGPVKITYVSYDYDGDGEISVEYENKYGDRGQVYVPEAAQFEEVAAPKPETDEERAEREEREYAETLRRRKEMDERRALHALLQPVGGIHAL